MVDVSKTGEVPQAVRKIGFIEFVLINTGLTIGCGTMIFVPMAASIAGPSVLLVLFLTLIISLVVVMSMAEIATIFPYSGGPIYSIRYGLPPGAANLALMLILLPMFGLILGSGNTPYSAGIVPTAVLRTGNNPVTIYGGSGIGLLGV
jgi:amino acid transporter